MPTGSAPRVVTRAYPIPAVATAGNDLITILDAAPFAGTITAVQFVAATTLTGAATNNRTHTLRNKGAAGAGTNAPATIAYNAGVNATQLVPLTHPVTPANATHAAGDVIQFESTHVGTGLADPGGILLVTYTASL